MHAMHLQCSPQVCRSNMPSLLKFNTIFRKNIENLCLVHIMLVPKLRLQAFYDALYVYVYDGVRMYVCTYSTYLKLFSGQNTVSALTFK